MLPWSHVVAGKACSTLESTWNQKLNQYAGSLHGLAARDWPMLMPCIHISTHADHHETHAATASACNK